MASRPARLSTFVRLQDQERFEREYYVTHSSKRRFTLPFLAISLFAGAMIVGGLAPFVVEREAATTPVQAIMILGGAALIAYVFLRPLKVSHGFATVTNQRLIYYEFNDDPTESYQHIESVYLKDITGVSFRTDRSWFRKSFEMIIWTARKGVAKGAKSFLGFLNILGRTDLLEPGPDAVEFIQDISGMLAARKFSPEPDSTHAS